MKARPACVDFTKLMMDFVEEHYYHLSKTMLCVLGQWPYQSRRIRNTSLFLVIGIMSTSIVFQIINFSCTDFSFEIFVQLTPLFIIMNMLIILLIILHGNNYILLEIYEFIKEDWMIERSEREMQIKHHYAGLSSKISKAGFISMVILLILGLLTFLFSSSILDIILPLDEPRSREIPFHFDYFVKQEYFTIFVIYNTIVSYITIYVAVVSQIMLIELMIHVFGMFDELGCRFKRAFAVNDEVKKCNKHMIQNPMLNDVIFCIKYHKKALHFVELLELYFSDMLIVILFGISISSCPTFLIALSGTDTNVYYFALSAAQITFGFLNMAIGQKLIDVSSRINKEVYFSLWYDSPVEIQKLLILVMERSQIPCILHAHNLFFLSNENFRRIFQTVLSYYTVLRQFS